MKSPPPQLHFSEFFLSGYLSWGFLSGGGGGDLPVSEGADRCLDKMGMNMAVLFCCLSDAIWFLMTTVHVLRRNIFFPPSGGSQLVFKRRPLIWERRQTTQTQDFGCNCITVWLGGRLLILVINIFWTENNQWAHQLIWRKM